MRFVVLLFFILMTNAVVAQQNINPYTWQSVSFLKELLDARTFKVQINGTASDYDSLLRIADSVLHKIEIHRNKLSKRKKAPDMPAGVIHAFTYDRKMPHHSKQYTPDSAQFYTVNGDSVFVKPTTEAMLSLSDSNTHRSWTRFLYKKLKPEVVAENGAPEGLFIVHVSFTIDKIGQITDVNILTDPGYGTAEEVLRVLRNSQLWHPAMYHGKPVKMRYQQKVVFMIQE